MTEQKTIFLSGGKYSENSRFSKEKGSKSTILSQKWRRVWDSNPRAQRANGFQDLFRIWNLTEIDL